MKNLRDPMLPHGSDKCLCPTCKEYFNSTKAFDMHRRGDFDSVRACLSPDLMLAKGMSKATSGHWITESRATAQGR